MTGLYMEVVSAQIIDSWETLVVIVNRKRITVSVHVDSNTNPLERELQATEMALRAANRLWP